MRSDPDIEGPRCLCGQQVAALHRECMAMASSEMRDRLLRQPGVLPDDMDNR